MKFSLYLRKKIAEHFISAAESRTVFSCDSVYSGAEQPPIFHSLPLSTYEYPQKNLFPFSRNSRLNVSSKKNDYLQVSETRTHKLFKEFVGEYAEIISVPSEKKTNKAQSIYTFPSEKCKTLTSLKIIEYIPDMDFRSLHAKKGTFYLSQNAPLRHTYNQTDCTEFAFLTLHQKVHMREIRTI